MVPRRNYLIHPHYIILTLVIAGITALFLGFTGAYLYNRIQQGVPPVRLPSLFFVNSLFILGTSLLLVRAQRAYALDNTQKFRSSVWIALFLTIGFLTMQIFAWQQLQAANTGLTSSTMASYMYLISGL
ncbi:MAG: cytochrome c oxidase subunit III, partial [Saprospiraceae bacterium]|nr:cytochrome c oxidase subunit III [Saprospiraceae bacterium]